MQNSQISNFANLALNVTVRKVIELSWDQRKIYSCVKYDYDPVEYNVASCPYEKYTCETHVVQLQLTYRCIFLQIKKEL